MKKLVTVLVLLVIVATVFVGCSPQLNFGKKLVKPDDMISILTELTAGTADVGIMDSIMAGYYMSQDTNYASKLMVIEDLVFVEEEYGIAARKEADSTIYQINKAIIEMKKDGTAATIAETYGLAPYLIIDENYDLGEDKSTDNDWATIKGKNKIVIGYTVFAPIAYPDANDNLVGFDIDFAKTVGAYLGLTVEFVEIDWTTKEFELYSKNIDLLWNGMTITPEREASMNISIPYLSNRQVAVIRKADKDVYTNTETMKDAIIAAEGGSAGQSIVEKARD